MEELIKRFRDLSSEELELLSDEIAQELRRRSPKPTFQRCPKCKGVGKHWGGYCTCALGRDLRLVEVGRDCSYDVQPGSDNFPKFLE
jgi:hypothetical protein